MEDFPLLIAELAPLAAAAGLQNISLQSEYCARYGWFYTAHAYRGTASVLLVGPGSSAATTLPELRESLQNALLDQLAAYYVSVPQL